MDELCRVAVGDATTLDMVEDDSVAAAIFSPPYNCEAPYVGYDDMIPWGDYERMVKGASQRIAEKLVSGGRVFLNVQPTVPMEWSHRKDGRKQASEERVNIGFLWEQGLRDAGLLYRDTIVWVQDSYDGACSWGSWLRPSAPNLRGSHEVIYLYYKDRWKRDVPPGHVGFKDEREGLGGDWTDLTRNVWSIPPSRSKEVATFPVEVPARAIRLSTWPGETVLDPFCGSGTTGVAAKMLGRRFVGVDLSAAQVETARRLITEAPACPT